ncbi:LOW QUALITY PROTEIN: caspase-8 [Coregonus clupeaformis]|uniref:LOW QUALITY PROTEIN: caspase-8 n=1 Tax=Coregonus clupeaformis TaxID=59861 RepID=UPI001E1C4E83|nr:LOW QUALITY PROTEIN: caspase-8 [Coregonus clupeaformis]
MEMDFQRLLLQVEQALSSEEVQALAFLCKDLLEKDWSSVPTASKLFSLLTDQELLTPNQPYLLADLLRTIQRHSLMRELGLDNQLPTTSSLISPYRKLLYDLSENITEDELREMKFLLINVLPRRKLEDNVSTLQVFLEMEKVDILSVIKLNTVESMFGSVCPMLKTRINHFKTLMGPVTQETGMGCLRSRSASATLPENQAASMLPKRPVSCGQSGSQPSSEVSSLNPADTCLEVRRVSDTADAGRSHRLGLLSTSGDNCAALSQAASNAILENLALLSRRESPRFIHILRLETPKKEEVGEYAMTGKKREVSCLIINNYNFRNSPKLLNNTEGTQVDERSLVSVFEWLGFETQVEPDCSREQLLSLVAELRSRDHSQMDCLVCCVLSHGLEGGVYGVDGLEVRVRELTEPFAGLECSSLRGKPKLFFIQACQGTKEQQPVFIQSDCPGTDGSTTTSSICTDAVVPRDSIPSDADFLLGMATVPHFSSFREKSKGTWFIQSLCRNLINLVPSGYDFLSILTKVNDDVSRMSNNLGTRKQMPQPAYSLRKRLVFPIPEDTPPRLCEPQILS